MDWIERMNSAMDYIESRLDDKIELEEVAKIVCCSTYHFQRMFTFIAEVSLSEYIRRRRLTLAAFDMQNNDKVINVAFKYGYDSPEAFSRAFKKMHGISPMSARDKGIILKAYPRISFQMNIKGGSEMNYRIEEKEAFNMYGISTEVNASEGKQYVEIPKFWQEKINDGTIIRMHKDFKIEDKTCLHAALYNFREGVFSYMICYHEPKWKLPEDYIKLEVPALTWAIFSTDECSEEDGTEKIQNIWKRIYPEWFPTTGYEHADGPEFEMYYTLENGKFIEEVWIPIMKK